MAQPSGMAARKEEKPIPDILTDPATGIRYLTGKFLGKGGFARCYELTDAESKIMYAGKIVAKSLLIKKHQKDKMAQEINIHRALGHAHVVQFHTFFEDNDYIYILLELCKRRSMMELHKRRRAITEPETRYYVKQIVCACQYLHNTKVIHRDLKLGNLFLNDDMEIKIGDFGLATRIDFEGERKRTLCGTPNYIAPEVLGKKGHSFEVDSWSLGCIIYTLLVGKPPFETTSLKDTYTRIKKNEYHIPSRLSAPARNLITRLLKSEPSERPNMDQIAMHEFFSSGYLPNRLPTSCLSMAPRFDAVNKMESLMRKPLIELNTETAGTRPVTADFKKDSGKAVLGQVQGIGDGLSRPATAPVTDQWKGASEDPPSDYWLSDLYTQLTNLVASKPSDKADVREDDAEDPAAIPIYWVSKWVDYSDKYGLGYQLCDNSVGVLFNDTTRLLLLANGENVQYIERGGAEHYHTLKAFPDNLTKKVTLLKYFRNYMTEHLLKAGANMTPREQDEISRLPCLQSWFRTRSGMVLHLSNGSVQINFFQDHTKIICCPLMSAVSYIDEKKNFRVFRFNLIEKHGCSKELACRLRYARTMVERLMNSKSASGKHKATS